MVAAQTDACVVAFNHEKNNHDENNHDENNHDENNHDEDRHAKTQWGIVTASDVLKSVAAQDDPQTKFVGDLAHRPLYSVHQFDYLFNALLKMTRCGVNRLVVRSDEGWIGFLHQKELMSLFANQSGLALLKIDQACSIADLKPVTEQIDQLVSSLNRKGIKTHYIAKLVAELHRKLLYKLTQWLLPEALHHKVCVLVMGSEGRSEQVIRTDQDNALIVQDGLLAEELAQIESFAVAFNNALLELGFPMCPGNVMLSNPLWRKSKAEFMRQVDDWFERTDADSFMNLAIFYDAQAIMGDEDLIRAVKQRLHWQLTQQPLWLRHFAKSALQFETPVSFFGALITQKNSGVERMDIKKGGIFPIVHGIRSFALQEGLQPSNTHWRIKALMDLGVINSAFGEELGESLNFFNTLRLESQLNQLALQQGSAGHIVFDNFIQVQALTHLQQDLLKQALGVVAQFKKQLTRHFKLQDVL
jgi:CBS domain-containing protein